MPGKDRCSRVLEKVSLCRVWWIAGKCISSGLHAVFVGRWGERLTSTSQIPALNVIIGRTDILTRDMKRWKIDWENVIRLKMGRRRKKVLMGFGVCRIRGCK